MARPTFILINNRHINASTVEELTFDDNNLTVTVVYNGGMHLSEQYSDAASYRRVKIKLNHLLRLGTLKDNVQSGCQCGCQTGGSCSCTGGCCSGGTAQTDDNDCDDDTPVVPDVQPVVTTDDNDSSSEASDDTPAQPNVSDSIIVNPNVEQPTDPTVTVDSSDSTPADPSQPTDTTDSTDTIPADPSQPTDTTDSTDTTDLTDTTPTDANTDVQETVAPTDS